MRRRSGGRFGIGIGLLLLLSAIGLWILKRGVRTHRAQVIDAFAVQDATGASCVSLSQQQAFIQGRINSLRTVVQDLSGAAWAGAGAHDESMRYQYQVSDFCSRKLAACDAAPSACDRATDACKQLARSDEFLFNGATPLIDLNYAIAYNSLDLQAELDKLAKYAKILNCPAPSLKKYTPSSDVGYTNPDAYMEKLKYLSPYYISPAIVSNVSDILLGKQYEKTISDSSAQMNVAQRSFQSAAGLFP